MALGNDYTRSLDVTWHSIEKHSPISNIQYLATSEREIASSPAPTAAIYPARSSVDWRRPNAMYPIVKRIIDVAIASLLLVLILPFVAIIALVIKATSPGAVIFRQIRVGQNMRLFTCYKFRSMVDNAEWHLEQNAELCATHAISWKLKKDPRVTRVGRVLRKLSLDELPQLVNVIKGDMSLVGPRPYMPKELEGEFGERAAIITAVRPGMTGLWQVSGRSSLTPSERIALDESYASGVNVRLDLIIMVKTFLVVLLSKGAL